MDRKVLREFTHKPEHFLKIENENYKQWVFRYTFLELEKDLSFGGDVTTEAIFPSSKVMKARVIAKEDGVLAGKSEIMYFLVEADSKFRPSLNGDFKVDFMFEDGDCFKSGDTLLEIEADIRDILAVERTVLNLLMRMSGIATFTRRLAEKVKDFDVLVVPTRKTLWGLLDKKAVVVGGGGIHRINLGDAVLVKDNHLSAIDNDYKFLFDRLHSFSRDFRFLEIEVRNKVDALKVAELLNQSISDKKLRTMGAVLFDNMSAEQVFDVLNEIKNRSLFDNLLFEASGGICEENILDYAKTGVDIISMGCLTTGVRSLDFGLEV